MGLKLSEVMHRAAELHKVYHVEMRKWMASLAEPTSTKGLATVNMAKMDANPMPPESRDAFAHFLFTQPVAVIYALASLRAAATPGEKWEFWKAYERWQQAYDKPQHMIEKLMHGDDLGIAFAKAQKKLERRGVDVDQLLA